MDTTSVVRGSKWIYIGGFLSNAVGYVFWVVASVFVQPDVVGSASAILAFQGLLVTVLSLGLPTGIRRFIGSARGTNDYQQMASYVSTSLTLLVILNLPCAALLILAQLLALTMFTLSHVELGFVGLFVLLTFWPPILVSLFNSLIKTETTARAQTASALAKLVIGVPLLWSGLGFIGIMLAFIASSCIMDIVLLLSTRKLLRTRGVRITVQISYSQDIMRGGLPAWIPNILTIAGQSIGVLFLYSLVGGTETGLYYMAFAIASIVYALPVSILSLMFPLLSGMSKGRRTSISKAIQLSLIVTVPVALILVVYPSLPLIILGQAYIGAAPLLAILAIGAILYPIYAGYYAYIYAQGEYAHVLTLGIVLNGSRLVLYWILAPQFAAVGVASSFTVGILIVLIALVPSARKIGYCFRWSQYGKTIGIPSIIGIALYVVQVPWIFGVPILLIASLVAYAKLGIVTKKDTSEVLQAFASRETLAKVYLYLGPISKLLFGD